MAGIRGDVGRKVSRIYRPSGTSVDAGFSFLLGASLLLKLSEKLASYLRESGGVPGVGPRSLEALTEAWLMAKAVYGVPLDQIRDYHKSELWFLVGRKANKGLLRRYIDGFKLLQTIKDKIVADFSHFFQDIHYLKVYLADGTTYSLDGQLQSFWTKSSIPLDYSINIDIANIYKENQFFSSDPLILFCARPDVALGEDLANFVFSIDGSSANKRIRKIDFFSPEGNPVTDIPLVLPQRRRFMLGIWPWQYKTIAELEKAPACGKVFQEATGSMIHYAETSMKFTEHTHNIDVMLRLIVLKKTAEGPAFMGVMTNLDRDLWDTARVVEAYVRRYPDVESGHKSFLDSLHNPMYYEQFLSTEKIMRLAQRVGQAKGADEFFSFLVEVLNAFAKKSFFPAACADWGLLKMKELFYRKKGQIRRDMAEDIVFNPFIDNELDENLILSRSAARFNAFSITDFSGRKLWILPSFSRPTGT